MKTRAKKAIKTLVCVVAVLIIIWIVAIGRFTYVTKYKIAQIDSSVSGDGKYELLFQSVGEPDFPYGDARGRIVLKSGGKTVTVLKFDVANDGAILYPDNWRVNWEDKCVKITISGEEQPDALYTLYFDGTCE